MLDRSHYNKPRNLFLKGFLSLEQESWYPHRRGTCKSSTRRFSMATRLRSPEKYPIESHVKTSLGTVSGTFYSSWTMQVLNNQPNHLTTAATFLLPSSPEGCSDRITVILRIYLKVDPPDDPLAPKNWRTLHQSSDPYILRLWPKAFSSIGLRLLVPSRYSQWPHRNSRECVWRRRLE